MRQKGSDYFSGEQNSLLTSKASRLSVWNVFVRAERIIEKSAGDSLGRNKREREAAVPSAGHVSDARRGARDLPASGADQAATALDSRAEWFHNTPVVFPHLPLSPSRS